MINQKYSFMFIIMVLRKRILSSRFPGFCAACVRSRSLTMRTGRSARRAPAPSRRTACPPVPPSPRCTPCRSGTEPPARPCRTEQVGARGSYSAVLPLGGEVVFMFKKDWNEWLIEIGKKWIHFIFWFHDDSFFMCNVSEIQVKLLN